MAWQPTTLTREQMKERRLEGGRLLHSGKLSQAAIARHLGVSRTTVTHWKHQLKTGGLRRLHGQPASGRPSKLTKSQKKILVRLLKKGARAADFPTHRWILPRIQKLIERTFRVKYHAKYLGRLLRQLGWTPQIPLPRALERDEELIRAWLTHDWVRIKKARRNGIEIVVFDEFGFSFQEHLSTTWAPCGQRPILRRVEKERRGVSTAVGLTLTGKIYKRHFAGSMHSAETVQVLQHLLRYLPHGFVLIWDRASIHKSKMTKAFLATHPEIKVEMLPAYAPDLNPEEHCHGNVKARLRNVTPTDISQMRRMLDQGFARLRKRPDLLLHFFHAAGLSVKQLS